ncbi:MAG: DUF934 domain-containing protein [Rhodospirillaceae bacterium]
MALLRLEADGRTVTPINGEEASQPVVDLAVWLEDRPEGTGVRLESGQGPEEWGPGLAQDLGVVPLIVLNFPRYADGRHYSVARKLRGQYGYQGRLRAVGDVLFDQIALMARCGFDEFEPADGTDATRAAEVIGRYRHVYQASSDGQTPVWSHRQEGEQ